MNEEKIKETSNKGKDKQKIFAALAKFHEHLKQPTKNGKNPFLKNNYVTLEGVQKAIDEACKGTGLTYVQQVFDYGNSNDKAVQTIILHDSGESLKSGPLTLTPQKKDPQGYGSALTYEKRYQLAAMFGISSELDDDGNEASNANRRNINQRQQNYRNQPQQPMPPRQQTKSTASSEFEKLVNKIAVNSGSPVANVREAIGKTLNANKEYQNMNATDKQKKAISVAKSMLGGQTND
ncbi:ERF family protein [Limosilactobacillus agrestimuris]|uniref:ERF family protein n=1 Tax=Limosilactobacillus agrestimuris TaxID=2941331 RepID=UPI00203FF769|nr:ERF family protein [Limosilactobacillus agrestimuris]